MQALSANVPSTSAASRTANSSAAPGARAAARRRASSMTISDDVDAEPAAPGAFGEADEQLAGPAADVERPVARAEAGGRAHLVDERGLQRVVERRGRRGGSR